MNEEALKYAFDLFVKDGYGDTMDDFRNLINSNPDALSHAFDLFTKDGYKNSIDDFKILLGVSKQPATITPKKKEESMVSESEVSSSVLPSGDGGPELKDIPFSLDYQKRQQQQQQKVPFKPSTPVIQPEQKRDVSKLKQFDTTQQYDKFGVPITQFPAPAREEYLTKPVQQIETKVKFEEKKEEIEKQVPEFLKPSVGTIDKDFLSREPKLVIDDLNRQYKDTGFQFYSTNPYDQTLVQAKAPNGKTLDLRISSGITTILTDKEAEAERLKFFIKENSPSIGAEKIAKLQKEYEQGSQNFLTQKQIDEQTKEFTDFADSLNKEIQSFLPETNALNSLKSQIDSYPEAQKNTAEYKSLVDNYNTKLGEYNIKSKDLDAKIKDIKTKEYNLKKAAGEYTKYKAQQGGLLGAIWNRATDTAGGIFAAMYNNFIDFNIGRMGNISGLMSEEKFQKLYNEKLKEKGYKEGTELPENEKKKLIQEIDSEQRDKLKKSLKYGKAGEEEFFTFNPTKNIREFFRENFGTLNTTEQYIQKLEEEGTIIQKGLVGVGGSLPAMIGPPVFRVFNMYNMVTDGVAKEMENDPDFQNISENEKQMIKIPIGIVGAALEEFGFRNLLKGKSVIGDITKRVLDKIPVGATASQIRSATLNTITEMGLKGGLALTGSALSEFETGALQQVGEFAVKDIYNAMKGKKMFDTPIMFSADYFKNVVESGLTESVGGGVLGIPNAISTAFSKDGFQGLNDDTFKMFEELSRNTDSKKFFVIDLKNKINEGKITKAEADKILENYDKSAGLVQQIPDEITDVNERKKAMDLLKERKSLEDKIQGKDPALAKPIQNQINNINEQLTKLTEDAIQKQTAGEVPVQPETGVGEEVVQGEPEPELEVTPEQIVTEEKPEEEVVVPEAEVKEEEVVEEVPVEEKNPEQEADLLEELITGKKKEPVMTPEEEVMTPEGEIMTPEEEEKVKPIRQLGTGANVYFETKKHRVNDSSKGDKVYLNIGEKDSDFPLATIEFDNPEDAVKVAEVVNKEYPNGVPNAILVDKYIEQVKKEVLKPKAEVKAEVVTPEVKAEEEMIVSETKPKEPEVYVPKDESIGSKEYRAKAPKHVTGRTRERTIADGTKIRGRYKLVSADEVLASHNEETFGKTKGFPVNEQGKTVNDRDYETDKAAQSEVVRIAGKLDERAVSQTPIVTKDGIVVDGNNRTMSRKLAAKQGTDAAYIEALRQDADMYGIDLNEIDNVKNPMLIFEAEQEIPYTTKEFSRFNKAEKKEKSPIEKAVELSKTITDRFRRMLGSIYDKAKNPSDVTSSASTMSDIRNLLLAEGILQPNELPRYINPETGTATKEGVAFLETLLIGSALSENTIRTLDNEGMGNAKRRIVEAVVQITKNAGLGVNSLQNNIENGIKLLGKAITTNQSVVDVIKQMDLFEISEFSAEDLAIAILLDGDGFKKFLQKYNSEVGTEGLMGSITKEGLIDELLNNKIKGYEQIRKNLRSDVETGQAKVQTGDGGVKPESEGKQGATTKEEGVITEKPKTKKSNKNNITEAKETDKEKLVIDKVIPTSEKTLSTAASLGGVAYELPGGVAIIQAFNLLGQPIYIGYKNGTYTRIDIDSFDNKNNVFTEKELNDLRDLKKEIVNQERKNQSDSKNPFSEQGRVAATDSVPNNIKQFVENLTKALGINKKIFIITDNDFNEDQYKKHGLFGTLAAIRSAILGAKNPFEFGSKRYMSDADAYYIYYDGNLKGSELFSVVSHEIGHIVEQELFKNASKETVEAIKNDYNNWVAKLTGKTLTEVQNETRDITIQHLLQGNVSMFDSSVHKYISSFSEYLADNVAKWARTSQKPKTLVDKFFSNLVNEFKKIRDYVFKTGNYSENIFKWLDELYNPEKKKSKKISDIIRKLKYKGRGGTLQSNLFGVPIAIWNAAMDTVAAAIDAGVAISEAIQRGADYISENYKKRWQKAQYENRVLDAIYTNAINLARENGISDDGIKRYLERKGLTTEQIDKLIKKRVPKEKKPPTAEEIVGKPKPKKVTVNEMAALKDQIRLEARAAREAKGDLNSKRKALAEAINKLVAKGTITVRQANAIIKRVNFVNLDNPIMIDRLIQYAGNIFNNADYDTRMQEIRALQSQVKKKNHTSMEGTVKDFISINPELIPDNRILEYIQALDDMNTRTPSYVKMNDMFDEVMSYKTEPEGFNAIKTFQQLMDKLESIALNEVKSVEDYINLIRDINAFKRKASQLLSNGDITQAQYDQAIENVGKDQKAVEKKYEKEITALKEGLLNEIESQRPKTNPNFTPEENALIEKYLEIDKNNLIKLAPEELYILNDLLQNIEDGQMDYYRFSDIVSKAYSKDAIDKTTEQLDKTKFDMALDKGKQLLSEFESSFWEGLLGMGRVTSGALQKFIVSPMMRAISSYEKFLQDSYNTFSKIKNKYGINQKDMNKLGMLTTYLQEYMAQFDPSYKGTKDIGKRDWFKEILNDKEMQRQYPSEKLTVGRLLGKVVGRGKTQLESMKEIWNSLPKDKDGNVDPKAVYDSYMANDGKYFSKKEKAFFDEIMDWKQKNTTTKQKAANELKGNPFKEIPFHLLRSRYGEGVKQIAPKASGANGMVRIEAGTGKERKDQKLGPININFEQLFINGVEQTARDYYLSTAIQDVNNVMSGVASNLGKGKKTLVETITGTLSEALNYEFDKTESFAIFKRLLAARASMVLFDPERTARELIAGLLSYPIRAKTLSGYKDLFRGVKRMKELLDFTESPIRLRENISSALDISDGQIKKMNPLQKATLYLAGFPERTMMVTSWMPNFRSEFKNLTGNDFDMEAFRTDKTYKQEYGKAIREAAAVADAQTEKIIGTTTKAGQRREIRIAPEFLANLAGKRGTVSKNTVFGQVFGFFTNYPYREVTEFFNGFKEAAEVIRNNGISSTPQAAAQLSKPLGIALNVALYGYLASVSYAYWLMLLGDDDDEERGKQQLEELSTTKGIVEDFQGNAISLLASRYGVGSKALFQVGGTIAYGMSEDEERKKWIKKFIKGSMYVDPLPVEKATEYKGKEAVLASISSYVPQLVVAADRYIDIIEGAGDVSKLYEKVKEKGIDALTEDEKGQVLAISALFKSSQLGLNLFGNSLPMYNKMKIYMKKLRTESGVTEKTASSEKREAYGGYKTIEELQIADPEKYKELSKKGGALYEYRIEQKKQREQSKEKKAEEFEQKYGVKPKKSTKKITREGETGRGGTREGERRKESR